MSQRLAPSHSRQTHAPQLNLCVLGSGSGGNSTVIRLNGKALLLDAGFGPRTTAQRLTQLDMQPADIAAIVLTHLDTDHFRPTWIRTCVEHRIRVFVHDWHLPMLAELENIDELHQAGLIQPFNLTAFKPWDDSQLTLTPVACRMMTKAPSATASTARAGRSALPPTWAVYLSL
ncbi:MAG: MBL fold metallo-hydrolase [Phycisphaerales bacterium]|nr:MBL fold metallo-hydrolase [Phycisphaerales bacterium]